jgi:hypothetical protein
MVADKKVMYIGKDDLRPTHLDEVSDEKRTPGASQGSNAVEQYSDVL